MRIYERHFSFTFYATHIKKRNSRKKGVFMCQARLTEVDRLDRNVEHFFLSED